MQGLVRLRGDWALVSKERMDLYSSPCIVLNNRVVFFVVSIPSKP